jgi:hypothetical protein
LLWLTLVVAMGLGWLVRERQLKQQAIADIEQGVIKWRRAAGALEHVITQEFQYSVKWRWDRSEAVLDYSGPIGDGLGSSGTTPRTYFIATNLHEPSE